jgi:hypothetical protein
MGSIPQVFRDMPMTRTIRMMLMAFTLSLTMPASAAEPTPWFGSIDQTPFHLDPVTMIAVTLAGDPLHTGSVTPVTCLPKSCATSPETATGSATTGSAPQK